ncbi:MAG: hypothetical protein LBT60_01415, partial [Oscillospiraceae bacterium]|nr:hypothetical protein [Oscillospiraceae bacterium]
MTIRVWRHGGWRRGIGARGRRRVRWGIPGLLAAALAFRLFSLSGAGRAADDWLAGVSSDPGFIKAVLGAELPGLTGGASGTEGRDGLAQPSALVAAYDAGLRTLSGAAAVAAPPTAAPPRFQPEDGEPPFFTPARPPETAPPSTIPPSATAGPPPQATPLPDGLGEITF